ncbi:MAG: hypothetical protein ACM3TR_18875 [Caulobacteraceae bacterium]
MLQKVSFSHARKDNVDYLYWKGKGWFEPGAYFYCDADKALEHIRYLSEEISPGVADTEEERSAAEYIRSVFEDYGYDVEVQELSFLMKKSTMR